jgi:phage terminase large subunit GpA-like protein
MTADEFDLSDFDFSAYHAGLRPDSILLVSDWADANRILSQTASSEPGKFRTERTPYLKEIMDALSPSSPVEKVVFMKGSQIGGTEAGNNWIGYVIDQAPGPMLVVQPTVEMGKRWSKGRLAPLIEDTLCLRGKVKDPRSRDSGNTVQSKEFPGGIVVITGANSAVGLRSMPVRYLFLDEIDAYPPDADSEGDPLTLAIQRTSTFARRKIFIVSTPTIQGLSRIEKEFNETDQRYFFVPCPHCDFFQVLKWENIHYDPNNLQAAYVCECCKKHIWNHHKTEMLRQGEWRSTNAEKANEKIIGFHLSSLYSPVGWLNWEQCAQNYEIAKDDDQLLKAWTNTTLGIPWEEKGDAPDWGILFDRREHYRIGIVPQGGHVLTAGVDVQNDRLEIEIVAWGPNKESWSVDYRIIYGSPSDQKTWQSLASILNEEFEGEDGIHRKINMLAIDAGFATQGSLRLGSHSINS